MTQSIEESRKTDRPAAGPVWSYGPEAAQLFVVGLWASTFLVTKAVFVEISPLAFAFVRFALMTVLAFAILALRNRGRFPPIRRADLLRFLVAGLTGYTLYQLGFVLGLDHTSPFSSSLLIAMVPFFTMVFLTLTGERSPRQAWIGLAVGIVGVVIFLADKIGSPGSLLGDALSLGAAVSFALYGLVNRPLVRAYPPESVHRLRTSRRYHTASAHLDTGGRRPELGSDLSLGLGRHYLHGRVARVRGVYDLELGHRPARRGDGHNHEPAGADPERYPLSAALWRAVRFPQASRRCLCYGWIVDSPLLTKTSSNQSSGTGSNQSSGTGSNQSSGMRHDGRLGKRASSSNVASPSAQMSG